MVHIVSDTSTLYSTQQAQEAGFVVAPLSMTIAGKSYRCSPVCDHCRHELPGI